MTIIKAGTPIILNIQDVNLDLDGTHYYLNGTGPILFIEFFELNTTTWTDGEYTVDVVANDTVNHTNSASFGFTIDSMLPTVSLASPADGAVIRAGTSISFTVVDTHLARTEYRVGGTTWQTLAAPYTLDTSPWEEGDYHIDVMAEDWAANRRYLAVDVTIDSTAPEITLASPVNDTQIGPWHIVDVDIVDTNLDAVEYYINTVGPVPLEAPYHIDQEGWRDGRNAITVVARDLTGSVTAAYYSFDLDDDPPTVVTSEPAQGSDTTALDARVHLDFDDIMNRTSVETGISMSPRVPYRLLWGEDFSSLNLSFEESLTYSTTYNVTLLASAKDDIGNQFEEDYVLTFTTRDPPAGKVDSDDDGMPDEWEFRHGLNPMNPDDANLDLDGDGHTNYKEYVGGSDPTDSLSVPPEPFDILDYWLYLLAAFFIGELILVLYIIKRRRAAAGVMGGPAAPEGEIPGGPPVGVPGEQYAPMQQPQAEPEGPETKPMNIKCPKCSHEFIARVNVGEPTRVVCPECGVGGTMQ
jgi:ribosomal protein S27E